MSASKARADEAERRQLPERIAEAGGEVGEEHHVARLQRLQAHRRGVEADAVAHQRLVELAGGDGDVVPAAAEVAELEVDLLDRLLLDQRLGVV